VLRVDTHDGKKSNYSALIGCLNSVYRAIHVMNTVCVLCDVTMCRNTSNGQECPFSEAYITWVFKCGTSDCISDMLDNTDMLRIEIVPGTNRSATTSI
jgi:hypothetical protein